jgi:hypothetical protein
LDFWERLSRNTLYLDETETVLEFDRSQVEKFYLPLAEYITARLGHHSRLVIGVAGPPGCGKSAFSALLAAVINAQACQDIACLVGMDGWHYPNSYLDTHMIEREGKLVTLRSIKGSPETFDVQAILQYLAAIRQSETVHYPVYSRRLHDPIPMSGQTRAGHRFVIVEGNYLFLKELPWDAFQSTFDIRIFVNASLEMIQDSLQERHLRGGKPAEFAFRHIHQVDLPNAERVLTGSIPASIVVHKRNSRFIESIEGLENQPAS